MAGRAGHDAGRCGRVPASRSLWRQEHRQRRGEAAMSSGTVTRAGTVVQEDEVVRYGFPERVVHWINAAAYTYLLGSGLALFTPYLWWLAPVMGGGGTLRFLHP